MPKTLRNLFFFIIGCLISAIPVISYAGQYPAKEVYKVGSNNYDTVDAACVASFAAVYAASDTHTGAYTHSEPYGSTRYTCYGTRTSKSTGKTDTGITTGSGVVSKVWICPNGGTLSGQICLKGCAEGEELLPDGQCKTSSCPASGTSYSSGMYDIGTNPSAGAPRTGCTSKGCLVAFSGTSPTGSSIVNGKTHYYATGGYDYMGGFDCTPSPANDFPSAMSDKPQDDCGAGRGKAVMNGKTICIDDAGNEVPTDEPASSSKETKTDTTKTNSDGSTETSSETSSSTTNCDGDTCTTTTTTTTTGGGGGGSGGGGSGGGGDGNGTTTTTTKTQSKGDFCKENPNDKLCKGTGEDGEEDEIKPGDPAKTNDLYESGERTITDSFSEFRGKVTSAPFYQAASGFFSLSVPGGSCSGLSTTVDFMGKSVTVDVGKVLCGDTANIVYGALSVGLLMAASWIAFRIAFL